MKLTIFGELDSRTVEQIWRCGEQADYGVLCADGHVGYSLPIGGAVAYPDHISPSGVGYDIGCGNKAVKLPVKVDEVDVPAVMREITRRISFGMGVPAGEKVDDPVLDLIAGSEVPFQRGLAQLAADQLGTVGGGNHYVDLFRGEDDALWVGVHFGSRGFGHKTATHYMGKDGGMDAPPTLLDATSDEGVEYIEAMSNAGLYAYAGRDAVVDKVLEILDFNDQDVEFEAHNHHNFAWRETHFGRDYWVVRKGCTPAFPGQQGFVGGSMGDISVILEGKDTDEARDALYSTVHGAGRQMSRNEAKGKVKRKKVWTCAERDCDYEQPAQRNEHPSKGFCPHHPDARALKRYREERKSEGKINWEQVKFDLAKRGIVVLGGDADEAPGAYKRLPEVLSAHEGSISILHTLRPVGVAMAGPGIRPDD